MAKHLILIATILFLITASANSQSNETNYWYFGSEAGMDFSSGAPVALLDGALTTAEGCATMSDPNGQLLLYTDGITVWNRNHIQMPNGFGLLGNSSSTQSGVIVPWPNNPDLYYVFTAAGFGGGPFCYSVVDMTLDGGLGDVTAVKNEILFNPCSERVNAVAHANGTDIWVLSHEENTNNYYAYIVTTAGINTTPVITSIGPSLGGAFSSSFLGYLKSNAQGTRLATATCSLNTILMFDFENSTGVLSNLLQWPATVNYSYGVEFSPDGSRLYASSMEPDSKLWQFDLSSGNAATIFASGVILATNVTYYHYGGIQMGPDGKMYVARNLYGYVGVINDPDALGVACNYVDDGIYLEGRSCNWGLPDFIQTFFSPIGFNSEFYCFGDSTFFYLTDTIGLISTAWNFGDAASGSSNTSTLFEPYHVFSDTGTFSVTLITNIQGVNDTVTGNVYIYPLPFVDFVASDTTACDSLLVVFTNLSDPQNYLWEFGDGSTDTIANPSHFYTIGSYDVTLTVTSPQGCVNMLTKPDYINIIPTPVASFTLNPGLNQNTPVNLAYYQFTNTSLYGNTFYWEFGDGNSSEEENPLHHYTQEGSYLVTLFVYNQLGCFDSTSQYYITVIPASLYFIPNAFSPNGDGENDLFHIIGLGVETVNLNICNRWGELIASWSELTGEWDGTYKGEPAETGAYIYYGDVLMNDGQLFKVKGNVTLVR